MSAGLFEEVGESPGKRKRHEGDEEIVCYHDYERFMRLLLMLDEYADALAAFCKDPFTGRDLFDHGILGLKRIIAFFQ